MHCGHGHSLVTVFTVYLWSVVSRRSVVGRQWSVPIAHDKDEGLGQRIGALGLIADTSGVQVVECPLDKLAKDSCNCSANAGELGDYGAFPEDVSVWKAASPAVLADGVSTDHRYTA
jgi:hypothetical protein